MNLLDERGWYADDNVVRTESGEEVLRLDDATPARWGPAFAVLPEVLAALIESAQWNHDGLCWGAAPCAKGAHHDECMRNRDILRRAGVLDSPHGRSATTAPPHPE